MPAPLLGAALISGGAALAGGALSAYSQGRMNKKSMAFQREMFDKTNAYNSPLEQRKRLEAAGLNPNLVYGGSAGGTAGTASQPAQPDLKAVNFNDAASSLGDTAQNYLSWRSIQQQTRTQQAQEENLKADTTNKAIDSVTKTINAQSGAISLRQKAELYNNVIQLEKERLRNLSVNTDYVGNKDAREHSMTQITLRKVSEEIKNLKTQGRVLNEEAVIKAIDRKLYQDYGLKPHDPYYMRILHNVLEKLNLNPFNDFKP